MELSCSYCATKRREGPREGVVENEEFEED